MLNDNDNDNDNGYDIISKDEVKKKKIIKRILR